MGDAGRDAKIEELDDVDGAGSSYDENILGLEVAVNDALVVGFAERAEQLPGNV